MSSATPSRERLGVTVLVAVLTGALLVWMGRAIVGVSAGLVVVALILGLGVLLTRGFYRSPIVRAGTTTAVVNR